MIFNGVGGGFSDQLEEWTVSPVTVDSVMLVDFRNEGKEILHRKYNFLFDQKYLDYIKYLKIRQTFSEIFSFFHEEQLVFQLDKASESNVSTTTILNGFTRQFTTMSHFD